MKIFKIEITEEVKSTLKEGTISGCSYFLPNIQLDRKQYLEVNKILELLGGKWNRSAKCHIFESDIADKLMDALNDDNLIDKKKTYQFFETPKEIAEKIVQLAEIKENDCILEPSAGLGSIVNEILRIHSPVYAIEIQDENRKELEKIDGIKIIARDFLHYEYSGLKFDKIIMNPPFTGGQDADHILHAYELLANGGRIISIVPSTTPTKEQKKYKELQKLISEVIDLPECSFEESGTKVNTKIIIINK